MNVQVLNGLLQSLNLSGIPGLRSSDLNGLVTENNAETMSPLKNLVLNKTNIDDDIAPWICSCRDLETLEVAETKISRVLLPSWKGDDDEINYVL